MPVAVLAGLAQLRSSPVQRLDERVIAAATDVTRGNAVFFDVLIDWQEVFLPWHVYLAALPAAVWTWRAGLRSRTIWGVATALVGWNIGLDVKLLVQRARPVVEDPISQAPGYSFPSGHVFNVTMAMACVLVMVWPLLRRRPPALRRSLVALAALVTVLTALDRIYLGVHYPSDTIAGALLALALTYSSWVGYRHTASRGSDTDAERSEDCARPDRSASSGPQPPHRTHPTHGAQPAHGTHPPRPGGRR